MSIPTPWMFPYHQRSPLEYIVYRSPVGVTLQSFNPGFHLTDTTSPYVHTQRTHTRQCCMFFRRRLSPVDGEK